VHQKNRHEKRKVYYFVAQKKITRSSQKAFSKAIDKITPWAAWQCKIGESRLAGM